MQDFKGVYLGFAPTDESAVICGEMEITIDDERIVSRHATGLEIQEEEILVSDFEPMTPEEVRAQYNEREEGSDCVSNMVGFKKKSGYHPLFLFTKDPQEGDLGLLVRMGGDIESIFGPIICFSPTQVARGEYEKAVEAIEQDAGKGVLPRLRNEGKAEKNDGDEEDTVYEEIIHYTESPRQTFECNERIEGVISQTVVDLMEKFFGRVFKPEMIRGDSYVEMRSVHLPSCKKGLEYQLRLWDQTDRFDDIKYVQTDVSVFIHDVPIDSLGCEHPRIVRCEISGIHLTIETSDGMTLVVTKNISSESDEQYELNGFSVNCSPR